MKIRQASIIDLLNYLEELYINRYPCQVSNILNIVDQYYCNLSNYKTILPLGNDFLTDWCDLNYSHTMENCPNIPGIIVYKTKANGTKAYGILYHSGHIAATTNKQINFLSYYYIHSDGYVSSHSFCLKDWDGWGAPIRYFNFPEDLYTDSRFWALGERSLTLHSLGHDVRQLQAFLHKVNENVPIHGYFESATLDALHEVQSWCNLPVSDNFELNKGGQKIIDFLVGDK